MEASLETDARLWSRNESDALATRSGCRFNIVRAAFAVWWIERYCRLYEGESYAGEPLRLRSCDEVDSRFPVELGPWSECQERVVARLVAHNEAVLAGVHVDWQLECFARLLGWEKFRDHWDRWCRRFRKSSIWVAKKNKKSPSLAALGMFLTFGDGEPGAKTFFAAKDGSQSRGNVAKHAGAMRDQSPDLRRESEFNKSEMQITHLKANSILKPLSSSNSRTQKSKEGLNGSVLVDETHVVDREYMNRLSRMGISRPNPIQAEFSTSGNDPESYGKERFDYAVGVIAGTIPDDETFAAVYAAPQTLTDEELSQDPVKYGRMANPAWGHTIDPEEFLADYTNSRRSVPELANFKMYRLNIWQRASNPWLSPGLWQACGGDFTAADCVGLPCWAGLDLSLTRDMTALALAFQDGKKIRLLNCFWLPEDFVNENCDKANYRQWEADGFLTVIPGNSIDHDYLRPDLEQIIRRFQPRELAYDKAFAGQLTHDLTKDVRVTRIEFPQTPLSYTQPCGDFERRLLEGRIVHARNPILTWQAGHVCLEKNLKTGLSKPTKPKTGGTHLTVDGIQASVMAVGRLILYEQHLSTYYEDKPLEVG